MNLVLIGMPGCGKSTVGVLLAKSLLLEFADTDLLLQRKYKMSLCDLLETLGLAAFKEAENRLIAETAFTDTVVATGGSAVYGAQAMAALKAGGIVIYLKLPTAALAARIPDIKTRGVAMPAGMTLDALYAERAPLYEAYADLTIDCDGLTAEQTVSAVVQAVLRHAKHDL